MKSVLMNTKQLAQVCQIQMGQSPPSSDYNDKKHGLPFFQGKSEFGDINPTPSIWCAKPIRVAEPNDVLISVRAPVGTVNIANQKCCIGRGLASLRFDGNYQYLYYFLMSKQQHLNNLGTGTTFKAINRNVLENLEIPLPESSKIQNQIVSKINYLFNQLNQGYNELKLIQIKLGIYKKSILNAAIRGKLVPQDLSDDPASVLLEKIKVEKDKLIKTSKIKKEKILPPIQSDEVPFELPNGWAWCRLRDIAEIKGGLAKDSNKTYLNSERLPYLRVANVQRGYLDLSEIKEIDVPKERIQSLLLKEGDILFNEGGDRDKLGRGWVWENQIDRCIHQNHVFRGRLYLQLIHPEFISHYANSFGQDYFLTKGKQTTNLASVSLSVLSMLPIPLPPPNEQKRIILKIRQLINEHINLSRSFNEISNKIMISKQAILKQAFEGKLL